MPAYSAIETANHRANRESVNPSRSAALNHNPISPSVIVGLVGLCDGVTIFVTGLAPLLWPAIWRSFDAGTHRRFIGLAVAVGVLLAINLMHSVGAYRFPIIRKLRTSLGPAIIGWTLTIVVLAAILYSVGALNLTIDRWLGAWYFGAFAGLVTTRSGLAGMIGQWQRAGRLTKRIAVVGAGPVGQRLLCQFNNGLHPELQVAGLYDDRIKRLPNQCLGHPILGTVDDLVRDVRQHQVDQIIVALPMSADWRLAEILNKLSIAPVDVSLCPDFVGLKLGALPVDHLHGVTLLNALIKPLQGWRQIAKAIEDRVLACLILLLISPVLAAVAIAIKLDSPGPVFFRQKRYGFNNELIWVLKFRSMRNDAADPNATQLTQRNDPRVTKVGAFIRRTSLDELPQFINVVLGQMSIVGPRPHALSAKAGGLLYQEAVNRYDSRHRMKPGITGWAQINGWRGETETVEQIAKRVEHDLYYIEHWSVLFDLAIIARTIFGGFAGSHVF